MATTIEHKDIPREGLHGIARWEVATVQARDELTVDESDLNKVCRVYGTNPNQYYVLTGANPVTWTLLNPTTDALVGVTFDSSTGSLVFTFSSGATIVVGGLPTPSQAVEFLQTVFRIHDGTAEAIRKKLQFNVNNQAEGTTVTVSTPPHDITIGVVPSFQPLTKFLGGTLVRYSGRVYMAKQTFTSGQSFNPDNWQEVTTPLTTGAVNIAGDWDIENSKEIREPEQAPAEFTRADGTPKPETPVGFTTDSVITEYVNVIQGQRRVTRYGLAQPLSDFNKLIFSSVPDENNQFPLTGVNYSKTFLIAFYSKTNEDGPDEITWQDVVETWGLNAPAGKTAKAVVFEILESDAAYDILLAELEGEFDNFVGSDTLWPGNEMSFELEYNAELRQVILRVTEPPREDFPGEVRTYTADLNFDDEPEVFIGFYGNYDPSESEYEPAVLRIDGVTEIGIEEEVTVPPETASDGLLYKVTSQGEYQGKVGYPGDLAIFHNNLQEVYFIRNFDPADLIWWVSENYVASTSIRNMEVITETDYENLDPKDPSTLYVVVADPEE